MVARLRPLLPDRALLPRRGPARRPPARVHADRPRDVVRRARTTCSTSIERLIAAVCERRRRRRCRAAVPAHDLRRGDAALRLDTPDMRFGARARATSPTSCAASAFRVFATGRRRAAASCAPINAGGASWRAQSSTSSTDVAKRARRQGARVGVVEDDGGWRSPIAKFLTPTQIARRDARRSAPRRATCCFAAPTSAAPPPPRSARCALDLARAARTCVDRRRHDVLWVVDFPMFERRRDEERWTAAAPPVHARRSTSDLPLLERSARACASRTTTS